MKILEKIFSYFFFNCSEQRKSAKIFLFGKFSEEVASRYTQNSNPAQIKVFIRSFQKINVNC